MAIRSREQHIVDHECHFDADDINEALAIHLAKQVSLDIASPEVSYTASISVSALTGLAEATVKLRETIVDIEQSSEEDW